MITWTQFERREPSLAAAGRAQFYHFNVGLGFLATVRKDGGPRVHPVCPVLSPAGLHVVIMPGPKLHDLRRDPRYALHSETLPPPKEQDGFAVYGTAAQETDPEALAMVRDQVVTDHGKLWPDFDRHVPFELTIDRCLLTLTRADGTFPEGPTTWRLAGSRRTGYPWCG